MAETECLPTPAKGGLLAPAACCLAHSGPVTNPADKAIDNKEITVSQLQWRELEDIKPENECASHRTHAEEHW